MRSAQSMLDPNTNVTTGSLPTNTTSFSNSSVLHHLTHSCFHLFFENLTRKNPIGVQCALSEHTLLSNKECNQLANQFAHYLLMDRLNDDVNAVVGVYTLFRPAANFCKLVISKAGGLYLYINPELSQEHLTSFLKNNKLIYIITQNNQQKQFLLQICATSSFSQATIISLEELPALVNEQTKTRPVFPPNSPHRVQLIITLINHFENKDIRDKLIHCLLDQNTHNHGQIVERIYLRTICKVVKELYTQLFSHGHSDPDETGFKSLLTKWDKDELRDRILFQDLIEQLWLNNDNKRNLEALIKDDNFAIELDLLQYVGMQISTIGAQLKTPSSTLTRSTDDSDFTPTQLFDQQVRTNPDHVAIVFPGQKSTSYLALEQQSNQLAHYLIQQGLLPENGVGLYLDASPSLVLSVMSCMKASGKIVPLDPLQPDSRIITCLIQARCSFIITQSLAQKQRVQQFLTASQNINTRVITLDEIGKYLQDMPKVSPKIIFQAQQIATVLFELDSFAQIRAIAISFESLFLQIQNYLQLFAPSTKDRVAQLSPISSFHSLEEILLALYSGATLYPIPLEKQYDAVDLHNYYAIQQISIAFFPIYLLKMLDKNYFPYLRVLISSGFDINNTQVQEFQNMSHAHSEPFMFVFAYCAFSSGFSNIIGVANHSGDIIIQKSTTRTQFAILENSDQPAVLKQPAKKGEVGEAHLMGSDTPSGYVNNPILTNERFHGVRQDNNSNIIRMFRTYLLAREQGDLIQIVGHADDVVEFNHRLINLQEIRLNIGDFQLLRNADVQVLAVTPQSLKLIVILQFKIVPSPMEIPSVIAWLQQYASSQLPSNIQIEQWAIADHIPIKLNGRVDRVALKESSKITPGKFTQTTIAPVDDIEKDILTVWNEALDTHTTNSNVNFIECNGYPLAFFAICQKLSELAPQYEYLSTMSYREFYLCPTPSFLARSIRRTQLQVSVKPIVLAHAQVAAGQKSASPCYIFPTLTCSPDSDYKKLASNWCSNRDLISFSYAEFTDEKLFPQTIEEMAFIIKAAICKLQAEGPYLFAGYTSSSIAIATEVAAQLEQEGKEAAFIVISASPPGSWQLAPPKMNIDGIISICLRISQALKIKNPGLNPQQMTHLLTSEMIELLFTQLLANLKSDKSKSSIFSEVVAKLIAGRTLALAELRYQPRQALTHFNLITSSLDMPEGFRHLGWNITHPAQMIELPYSRLDIIQSAELAQTMHSILSQQEVAFKISRINTQLRRRYTDNDHAYIHRPYADEGHCKAPVDMGFVSLSIVHEDEQKRAEQLEMGSAKNRTEALSSLESLRSMKYRLTLDLHDIFSNAFGQIPQRVLFIGKPGTGKTTFCKRIVYLHANQRLFNNHFDVMIWIKLRNLTSSHYPYGKKYTLADLLDKECLEQMGLNPTLSATDLLTYLNTLSERLCIIFDGLNELPENSPCLPLVKELLQHPKIHILATTTPDVKLSIRNMTQFDLCLENVGFSDNDISAYLEQYYINDPDNTAITHRILYFLQKDLTVYGLAHFPAYIELICAIADEQFTEISRNDHMTMTGLCHKIRSKLWTRYFDKIGTQDRETLEKKQRADFFLEALAFFAMEKQQIIISSELFRATAKAVYRSQNILKDEDIDIVIREILDPGFLTSSDKSMQEKYRSHYYLHYSLHEFFAASYFVGLYTNGNVQDKIAAQQFIKEHLFNQHYEVFWWFVSGLMAIEHPDILHEFFNDFLSAKKDFSNIYHFTLLIRCLEETKLPKNHPLKAEALKKLRHIAEMETLSMLKRLLPTLKMTPDMVEQSGITHLLCARLRKLQDFIIHSKEPIIDPHLKKMSKAELDSLDPKIKEQFYQDLETSVNRVLAPQNLDEIILLLGELGHSSEEVIDALSPFLKYGNSKFKETICRAFRKMNRAPSKMMLDLLCQNIGDDDVDVRNAAARAIIAMGMPLPNVLEALIQQTKSTDPRKKKRAIKTLGALGLANSAVLNSLKLKLLDQNYKIRVATINALGKLRPMSIESAILVEQGLIDPDARVRKVAIEVRHKMSVQTPQFLNSLFNLLLDDNLFVKNSASHAINAMKQVTPKLLNHLCQLMDHENALVRSNAVTAVGNVFSSVYRMRDARLSISPSIIAALTRRLSDTDLLVINNCLLAIANINILTLDMLKNIVRLLKTGDEFITNTIQRMIFIHLELSAETERFLASLSQDTYLAVKEFARKISLHVARPTHNTYINVQHDLNSKVTEIVTSGISSLCTFAEEDPEKLVLLQPLINHAVPDVRKKLAEYLGNMEKHTTDIAIKILCELLNDNHERVILYVLLAFDKLIEHAKEKLRKPWIVNAFCFAIKQMKENKIDVNLIENAYHRIANIGLCTPELLALLTLDFSNNNEIWRRSALRVLGSLFNEFSVQDCQKFISDYAFDDDEIENLFSRCSIEKSIHIYVLHSDGRIIKAVLNQLLKTQSAIYLQEDCLCCYNPEIRIPIPASKIPSLQQDFEHAFQQLTDLPHTLLSFEGIKIAAPKMTSSTPLSSAFSAARVSSPVFSPADANRSQFASTSGVPTTARSIVSGDTINASQLNVNIINAGIYVRGHLTDEVERLLAQTNLNPSPIPSSPAVMEGINVTIDQGNISENHTNIAVDDGNKYRRPGL